MCFRASRRVAAIPEQSFVIIGCQRNGLASNKDCSKFTVRLVCDICVGTNGKPNVSMQQTAVSHLSTETSVST